MGLFDATRKLIGSIAGKAKEEVTKEVKKVAEVTKPFFSGAKKVVEAVDRFGPVAATALTPAAPVAIVRAAVGPKKFNEAIINTAADVARAAPRAVVSTGLMAARPAVELATGRKAAEEYVPKKPIEKALFGSEPIKSLDVKLANTNKAIESVLPESMKKKGIGSILGVPLIAGTTALDLLPLPEGKGAKAALKASEKLAAGGATKTLLGATEDLLSKAGNINLTKFNIPTEAKQGIADIVKAGKEFVDQRRGVQTFEDTRQAAEGLIASGKIKINLSPGKALNAEERHALSETMAGLRTQVDELATLVKTPEGASDLNLARLAAAQADLGHAIASVAGSTAEAGRALNAGKIFKDAVQSGDMKLIQQAIERSGGRETIESVSNALAKFGTDEAAKYNFVKNMFKPGFKDYMNWYWYSSILSGPVTHVRNIFGNASNTAFDVTSKPFAAVIDSMKTGGAKILGKDRPREVFLGELPQDFVGAYQGLKQGLAKGLFMLQNGYAIDDVAKAEFRTPEVFKGILPNLVGRGLEAADQVFRSINAQRELVSGAYAAAKKTGAKGAEFDKIFNEMLSNPSKELIEQVAKEGKRAVFRQEGGPFIQLLLKARSDEILPVLNLGNGKTLKLPNPLRFVVPFIETPANIMKAGAEASPLGFLSPMVGQKTAREGTRAQGRAALGSLILAPIAMMAAEGSVSGSGPSDPATKDALYRSGWQPNSIKIGDKWYSYKNIQPIAIPISVVANAYEQYMYEGGKISLGSVLAKTGNSLLDQSFLSGLSGLQQAMAEPETRGKAFLEGIGAGLVPLSGFQSQIARSLDRNVRAVDSFGEKIISQTPFASKTLPARYDTLGNEIKRPGDSLNAFNPLTPSEEQESAVDEILKETGFTFSKPAKKISGIDRSMNNAEYAEFSRVSGSFKSRLVSELSKEDSWNEANNEERIKVLDAVSDKANELARKRMSVPVEARYLGIEDLPTDKPTLGAISEVIQDKEYKALDDTMKRKVMNLLIQDLKESSQ